MPNEQQAGRLGAPPPPPPDTHYIKSGLGLSDRELAVWGVIYAITFAVALWMFLTWMVP